MNEKTFTPQLSQQDLAEMIDREGLKGCYLHGRRTNGAWIPFEPGKKASDYVKRGFPIRLAPDALTEFGLKPGMVPHNPDGLPADQITEGGKYRAWSEEERIEANQSDSSSYAEVWYAGMGVWVKINGFAWPATQTYRVPINTPFPKQEGSPLTEEEERIIQRGYDHLVSGEKQPEYRCRRCGERVNMVAKRCGCKNGPSPWEPSCTEPPVEQSSVTQQAGQSLTPRTDAIKPTGPWHEFRVEDYETLARTLETELAAALAQRDEANRLLGEVKRVLQEIYDDTEGYADGALDASAHDRLCNDISSKIRQPLTQITNHPKP